VKANRRLASGLAWARNMQQWYVTISRGKKGVHIFTCDKEELRENITRAGERPLAIEAKPPKEESQTVDVEKAREHLRHQVHQHAAHKHGVSRGMGM
jgi:hypothetical protein